MLLNIIHPELLPSIKSNVVAEENYEPTNLISSDLKKKSNGFLAYSCVKPPVDLIFDFLCPVNINYITIWPCVGLQKSTGFEILIKSKDDYVTVGYGYIKEEPGVVFYKGDIYSNSKLYCLNVPQLFHKTPMRGSEKNLLENASSVMLRITRTSSTLPAISKTEIWGKVARSSSRDLRNKVLNIWNSILKPAPHTSHVTKQSLSSKASTKATDDPSTELKIPEEFLDMITYEIMSMPLVLPSGKVIDQSSLDKHNKAEAVYGRSPSDPFSGQQFTDLRKPFLSFALKGQIDKFLACNAHCKELNNIPRTVGRCVNSIRPIIIANRNSFKDVNIERADDKITNTETNIVLVNTAITPLRNERNKRKYDSSDIDSSSGINVSLRNAINSFTRVPKLPKRIATEVQQSCTTLQTNRVWHLNSESCFKCNSVTDLFKSPCKHFICRTCLVSAQRSLSCTTCGFSFESKDVERFHNV